MPIDTVSYTHLPTGIDVELATEAFKRMGYQVEVVQINWEKKKELVESGEIDCIMGLSLIHIWLRLGRFFVEKTRSY